MSLTAALMVMGATMSTSLSVQDPQLTPLFRVASTAPDAERPPVLDLRITEIGDPVRDLRSITMRPQSQKRPSPLVPLYTSLAVLQVLDAYTTSAALSRGAHEANPAMQPLVGKALGTVAAKAIATASTIYFVERAWKRHRKGAVILVTSINVASAAIVAHNSRVARRE